MKRLVAAMTALIASTSILAASAVVERADSGHQLKRGTTNIGTPHTTVEACKAAARTDAEARKTTSDYSCQYIDRFRVEYKTDPPPPTSPPAVQWTQCASEYGTCSFTGSRAVRYGASATQAGRYVERTMTGPVTCNNATFGDPVPGADKWCWVGDAASSPPVTPPPVTPPSSSASCVPQDFLGMHWHRDVANWSNAGPTVTTYPFAFGHHRLMSKEGIIRWSQVNPSPGVYVWADLDKVAAKLPAGATMELVIADPPDWARDTAKFSGSCKRHGWDFCPVQKSALQDYVRAFLARYGAMVGSIDPANEWNIQSSYPEGGSDHILDDRSYAHGPVSSLVDSIRWIREVLTETGRGDVILWMGSTTGLKQITRTLDHYPELKTLASGAQMHCYDLTASNWAIFEKGDYCQDLRAQLDARGLKHWLISSGEHGIHGARADEWWNTLVQFAALGWHRVGVYSGDDDGDGGVFRGGDPLNLHNSNTGASEMFDEFHRTIAGRRIVSIDKSAPRWKVTTEACK